MIKTFNKHQRWLMIVIAILAIPFVFYFNKTDFSATRSTSFGRLYGRDVSLLEIDRGSRMFDLARDLGMSDFLQDLVGNAQTEREAKEQFALNLLILQHEAATLGIRPTGKETAAALTQLRAFHGDKGFDIKKYNDAVQNYLGPRGFSEAQLEELAGYEITLQRIKDLLGTGVAVSDAESKANFDQAYGRYQVAVVRLKNSDVANEVKITDEEIRKAYEQQKEQLKSDEKRRVQFVALSLTEEQKKLTGKERVDALQKLADKANDVSQALAQKGADFADVAAKFQLPVQTTGDFTQSAPNPQLSKDPQLAESAFQLTKDEPTSDALQGADGFYILHLAGVTPAQPLTLEEAKPKLVQQLTASRERELLGMRAAKVAHDLREALKAGEPAATAAQKANVKLETLPSFTLADELDAKAPKPDASPDLPMIKRAVADLHSNEVSDPLPLPDGTVIAVVEKREPPDAAQNEKRAALDERYLRNERTLAFLEWLRERRRAAGVVESTVQPS